MARRCDRPGCSEVAAVAYGFDAGRLLVWLDRIVDDDRARAGGLCRRHAEHLTVPRGWWLDDRRLDLPELFRPAPDITPAPAVAARPPRRQRRKRAPASEAAAPEPPAPDDTAADQRPTDLVSFDDLGVLAHGAVALEEAMVLEEPDAAPPVTGTVVVAGAVIVEDVDPAIAALLAPQTPLLARAFSGVARPDRPAPRARRNGAAIPPEPGT